MRLTLPIPPSTNSLFIQRGRKRVKTQAYREWQEAAQVYITLAKQEPVKGPVSVDITIPENRRRDIDNYAKPLLDLLVKSGMIEDDRCAILRKLSLWWSDKTEVEVTISKWGKQ